MGHYVGVNFSFSTGSLRRLQEAACATLNNAWRDFPGRAGEEEEEEKPTYGDFQRSYTARMLEEIRQRPKHFVHLGNKGDMFIWGGVWNYYDAHFEIPFLSYFLKTCWHYEGERENILFDFDRALLIVNREQQEASDIYEFSQDEETKEIKVREMTIDLCWNQN